MSTGLFFKYKTPFRILISVYPVPWSSSPLRFINNDCSFACSSLYKVFKIKIEYLFHIYSGSYISKLGARASIFFYCKNITKFYKDLPGS